MSLLRYSHVQNESSHCGQHTQQHAPLGHEPMGIRPHELEHWEPGTRSCIPSIFLCSTGQQGWLTGRSIISSDTNTMTSRNMEGDVVSGISLVNINLCQPVYLLTAGKEGQVHRCKLMNLWVRKSKFSLGTTFLNKTRPFSAVLFIRAASLYCSFPI